MHRNLTRYMYLTVGTLWQLTAAPKIDAFELKKYLAIIVADKIGYKEKSEFEQSSRDIQGKQKVLLFLQESVHVLNEPYRTDGETSRRSPDYSSMNSPVCNTTQVQATIELQQSLHLHYQAGLPQKIQSSW